MNAAKANGYFVRRSTTCAIALIVAVAGSSAQAKKTVVASVDDQAIVQCKLPPQMRSLGNNVTFLAAGRIVSTTIADCKVRGGSYDGHGPGALAAQAPAPGVVPVTVGGDQSRAGCPKSGLISGLKGSGGLSVRSAPGATSARVDKLGNGKRVFMCDWSSDGAWVGVVYPGAAGVDCGVSKMIGRAEPYSGACRSGWVSSKYVKPKA
jgi:hypothetical protein